MAIMKSTALVILFSSAAALAQPAEPADAAPADTPPAHAPAEVQADPVEVQADPAEVQTDPVDVLRVRADAAFAAGDFATALPIYKDVAVRLRNDPERVAAILERVRVCEANLPADAGRPDYTHRVPHAPPREGEIRELLLQDLGNFDYDAVNGGNIPDDVRALDGLIVKLKGYMIPINEARTISSFALVPDLFACCFGQPPQLQHTALVKCPPGKGVAYYPDEIVVTGKLRVREIREDGFIVSIFEVEPSSVKPAPR